ncbi:MAG: glycosyltransferase family 4 protein [Acidobacteriota bacterium]
MSKKRLGVNIVRLTRPFTGVGRYVECILDQWSRMKVPFSEIVLYAPREIDSGRVVFSIDEFRMRVVGKTMPDPLWEWQHLTRAAREVEVLFCPSYTVPLGYAGKCAVSYLGPAITRCGTWEWFRNLAYQRLHRYSARHAGHVFTCSASVKNRVVEGFRVPAERVSVTYLAPSSLFRPIDDRQLLETTRLNFLGTPDPYVLFVGKLTERHSIPNLIGAFARLRKNHPALPHRLLLVGPNPLHLNITGLTRAHQITDGVVHVPFVPHDQLPPVYAAADIFVFPASDAEGFGIPVVEAMACGTPVISTHQGSIREFGPGAALLAPTSSTEDLHAALEELICNGELKTRLRIKGLERAAGMTWQRTARKTMDVLWKLAGGDR